MATRKHPVAAAHRLERIKQLVIIAMFSDDELMDRLVLKGGNALDLVHRISVRASVDIDFSIADDFAVSEHESIRKRIERALQATFDEEGLAVFDVTMKQQPPTITPDLADFWGGYQMEFKLIDKAKYKAFATEIEQLRRNALMLGQGSKFVIEISRFEHTEGKQEHYVDGHRVFVYSPEMMVAEKLRAICQQMPEYGRIVRRNRAGSARARDFVDIHTLITALKLDMTSPVNRQLMAVVFSAKKVPGDLLGRVAAYREFHRPDFPAVEATVKTGFDLRDFDFYFDYVVELACRLEPLGDV